MLAAAADPLHAQSQVLASPVTFQQAIQHASTLTRPSRLQGTGGCPGSRRQSGPDVVSPASRLHPSDQPRNTEQRRRVAPARLSAPHHFWASSGRDVVIHDLGKRGRALALVGSLRLRAARRLRRSCESVCCTRECRRGPDPPSEAYVGAITRGAKVGFRVSAFPDQTFQGVIAPRAFVGHEDAQHARGARCRESPAYAGSRHVRGGAVACLTRSDQPLRADNGVGAHIRTAVRRPRSERCRRMGGCQAR